MVILKPLDDQSKRIWQMIIEVCRYQRRGWTLIGAQMVALHGFEHGRAAGRSSLDADLLVDVRAVQDGTERLSRALLDLGFEFEGVNTEGIGHRFRRKESELIDVLAPDGLGARTSVTTVRPARTVSVPGGGQALARSELVEVSLDDAVAEVPRPSLLGAILLKARAIDVDDVPDQQRRDLAFLLSLVQDPRALLPEIRPTERRWLRKRKDLLGRGSWAWHTIEDADAGYAALRILAGV